MTSRKTRRGEEHERDRPAGTPAGDHSDRAGERLRVGDALLRQAEARGVDVDTPGPRRPADSRRHQGKPKGGEGR